MMTPEEKLACAVVEQAVMDSGIKLDSRWRTPGQELEAREAVRSAREFLGRELWEERNVWGDVLREQLGGIRKVIQERYKVA